MQLPIVSNNGTSAKALVSQQLEIYKAAKALYEKMQSNFPHPRDYYHVPGTYEVAKNEAIAKIAQVNKIMEDCQEMALAIQKMGE